MNESQKSRQIRVFISSTFRDFAEERDLLVKKIFPELRRRCRERKVELVDVDLRWGITEAEAQQGKVLPICLAEIDRARPYFMGLIGERYGWVPDADFFDVSLLMEQPWLEEHRGGKSVTELEILHGVLNNPAMEGRAFFYFRDPAYSHAKGGPYLSEDSESLLKLAALKDRIRHSGFPVMESYPTPEALADRVLADLWKLIDDAYPAAETPDPLAIERGRHEAYGTARLRLYLGGDAYFAALDAAMVADPFTPVLITGASGGGKSALLANWTAAHTASHPETLPHLHHLGASSDAADPVKLVTRIMQEIARATGEELTLESDPQKIFDLLPEWLARASAFAERQGREWLIVLDGLDKLSSLRDLRWWPAMLPPGVKLIVSCLDGEMLDALRKRMAWTELSVQPLSPAEQRSFITGFLGRYRKSLTPPLVERVQAHPLSGNPLFLITLLDELRVFGVHEELEIRLTHYLQSEAVDDLFERVLERVEGDTSPEAVRTTMEAIWASRAGLAQDELLAITGLVPATWAPIHNALDEAILESGGRLTFGHDYFRKAVEDRYLPSPELQKAAHLRLAEWFDQQEVSPRVAEELPWQWHQASEEEKLKESLTSRKIFTLLLARSQFELLSFWLSIGEQDNLSLIYSVAFDSMENVAEDIGANLAIQTANFLLFAGFTDETVKMFYQKGLCVDVTPGTADHKQSLLNKLNYAEFLRIRSEYKESEALLRDLCSVAELYFGKEDSDWRAINTALATVLWNECRLEESEAILQQFVKDNATSVNLSNQEIQSAIQLALVWNSQGKYSSAIGILKRVVADAGKLLGENSTITQDAKFFMAKSLYLFGSEDEAFAVFEDVLHWQDDFLGVKHPNRECVRFWMAKIMASKGDYAGAEQILREDLEVAIRRDGIHHPETRAGQSELAAVLIQKGLFEEAEVLLRECVVIGASDLECGCVIRHADVMMDRLLLAKACYGSGKIEESERLALLTTDYFFELGGKEHFSWKEASELLRKIQNSEDKVTHDVKRIE